MSFDRHQLRSLTERVLAEFGEGGRSAENIVLGTCAKESDFGRYLRQRSGPARGPWQIEKPTFNYLKLRYSLKHPTIALRTFDELEWDIRLGIIFCRLKYKSIPAPLPPHDSIVLQGQYWDKYYNANPVHGTVEEYVANYTKYVVEV